jgi:taurine dioxygenase
MATLASARVSVRPLNAALGAEITGIDLREPLGADTAELLRKALCDHQVLFLRDQDITVDQQVAFAQCFGPVDADALYNAATKSDLPPGVTTLRTLRGGVGAGAADVWHADSMFRAEPPGGAVLRAVKLPRRGGDTLFASMATAYEALSPPMQRFLEGLQAEHSMHVTGDRIRLRGGKTVLPDLPPEATHAVHPIVRIHPGSGRKMLFVSGSWTTHIVGLEEHESNALLSFLFEHVKTPEFHCRFSWEVDSVAVWDNRAVLHYAAGDYDEERIMVRVSIAGERPLGPTPDHEGA